MIKDIKKTCKYACSLRRLYDTTYMLQFPAMQNFSYFYNFVVKLSSIADRKFLSQTIVTRRLSVVYLPTLAVAQMTDYALCTVKKLVCES